MSDTSCQTMRVVFLDTFFKFNSPVDMYCPECGRRAQAGIYAIGDSLPSYYSKCYACDWSINEPAEDYAEDFYHYYPENLSSHTNRRKMMFPEIVTDKMNVGLFVVGYQSWASYDPETNTIHLIEGVKPRWLAILHEYGHWLIGYAPDWLHRRVSLDYEYDRLWTWLDLSRFINLKGGEE